MSFFYFCSLKSKSDFRIRFNASFRVYNPRFLSGYGVFEKIEISYHLAVITVFRFTSVFWALPVSWYLRNPYESLALTFSYVLQKSLSRYLQWPRSLRVGGARFTKSDGHKKTRQSKSYPDCPKGRFWAYFLGPVVPNHRRISPNFFGYLQEIVRGYSKPSRLFSVKICQNRPHLKYRAATYKSSYEEKLETCFYFEWDL